jgi:flagellar biosynthesis chaperone FliJ
MKKFHSPASRLLSLARQQQRLAELLVARARAADAAALQRQRDAESTHFGSEQSLTHALAAPVDIATLQTLQSVSQAASDTVAQRRTERRETAAQLAETLAELQERQTRTRSLERLESRHFDAWRRDALREQSHQIDEYAGRRRWQSLTTGGES